MTRVRTTVTKISATIAIIFAAFASPTWCAPPLATDDASTLTPGACQLEIEQRRFRSRVERDFASACNFLFDAEMGIGHQRITLDGVSRADSIVYQFKKVLVPAVENGWAVGIAVATVRAVNEGLGDNGGTRQNIINAIASRQFGVTALHMNVGIVSDHESAPGIRRNSLSWAIATEHEASSRWTIVGDIYGQRGVPATAQIGLRWWVLPKYMQLTTSFGAQRGEGRDGRWVSLGVRFETGESIN